MKKGDARRNELLDTAERLFYQKGYEKTSVQDIIDAMHYSKGGFYHHFDSKLSVLEAICEQRALMICERAQGLIEREDLDAVRKINALLVDTTLWKDEHVGFVELLIRVAYREDGALMREKMKRCQLLCMQPMMESVLRQGVMENVFFLSDAKTMAQLILRMYMQFTDEAAFLLAEERNEHVLMEQMILKLRVYRLAIERTLAAPFGSIVLFDAEEMQAMAQKILADRNRQKTEGLPKGVSPN